jgi:tetratricopeptide (TPR) repeat protein
MGRFRIAAPLALLLCVGCGEAPKPPASQPASTAPGAMTAAAGAEYAMPMAHVPTSLKDWAQGAMLFDGLGDFHRAVTTASPEAQRYFDQGMRLMWAFNHDEATRSFARAAELDPDCASCYWGVALTVGPNYNLLFMVSERAKVASEALALAQKHAAAAQPVEQALIAALAKRYPSSAPLDAAATQPVLVAYAAAMKEVAGRYPRDLDVQVLYAESLMNTNAWKLWTAGGKAAPGTDEVVATLASVLKADPEHPGANHYYVHALEASPHPEAAVASAERLRGLMPEAGHLVHMPAHIFQRIGRYEDAAEANRRGAAADLVYVGKTHPPDYYPVMYTAHNYQFLAFSAAMEGRRAETIAAADNSRKAVSDEMLLAMPGADWYVAEMYTARVRFGLWDEILAMSPPHPKLPGLTAGYLYGRALALAAKGQLVEARAALANLQSFAASVAPDAPAGMNSVPMLLAVAVPLVQARIAAGEHRNDDALAALRLAVAAEDKLAYNEPADWFVPSRQVLGAALLAAGKAAEAESIYREDLQRNRANGWSLYGLGAALKAQGKNDAATQVGKDFAAAWQRSDITLSASAI